MSVKWCHRKWQCKASSEFKIFLGETKKNQSGNIGLCSTTTARVEQTSNTESALQKRYGERLTSNRKENGLHEPALASTSVMLENSEGWLIFTGTLLPWACCHIPVMAMETQPSRSGLGWPEPSGRGAWQGVYFANMHSEEDSLKKQKKIPKYDWWKATAKFPVLYYASRIKYKSIWTLFKLIFQGCQKM